MAHLGHQRSAYPHSEIEAGRWQVTVAGIMHVVQDIDAAAKSHFAIDHA